MILNETLQPEPHVGDGRYPSYGLGHIQQVRLHEPWNIVPEEYYSGAKLGQCNFVLSVSGV
jgi:hypothetical protein